MNRYGQATLNRNRIILEFAIAVTADIIQFPITAGEATGFLAIPSELADFLMDCVVVGVTTMLRGFHWMGRYKLLERIGEGGCSVVYVAEQTESVRRPAARKVIKLGLRPGAVRYA